MKSDLSGFNHSIANSTSIVEDIQRQQEEALRAVDQANQNQTIRMVTPDMVCLLSAKYAN